MESFGVLHTMLPLRGYPWVETSSSKREINFVIDLLPYTKPISIPLLKMDTTQLKELKEELNDFQDNGFIKTSISPLR